MVSDGSTTVSGSHELAGKRAAVAPGVSASPFLCLRNLMLPFASLNPDPC